MESTVVVMASGLQYLLGGVSLTGHTCSDFHQKYIQYCRGDQFHIPVTMVQNQQFEKTACNNAKEIKCIDFYLTPYRHNPSTVQE